MKQKLISKLKRVALALFAALCVGNVWGAINKDFFFPDLEKIELDSSGTIFLKAGAVATYKKNIPDLECTVSLIYEVERAGMDTVCVTNHLTTFDCSSYLNSDTPTTDRSYWYWYNFNDIETGANQSLINYYYQIPNFDEYLGSTITVKVYYKLNMELGSVIAAKSDTLALRKDYVDSETFVIAGITGTNAEWTNDSKKFVISGGAVDVSKIRVKYKVIGVSEATPSDDSGFESVVLDVVGNAFSFEVDYSDFESAIVWTVTDVSNEEDENPYEDGKIFRCDHCDNEKVTYTWVGEGETNSWMDPANWSPSREKCHGYPGSKGGDYYRTSVVFTGNADVDLGGKALGFVDDGAFTFAENTTVRLSNGRIVVSSGRMGANPSDSSVGANGTTIIFNNVDFRLAHPTGTFVYLTPRSGTTLIFEGDNSTKYESGDKGTRYLPLSIYENTTFVVRDGEAKCKFGSSPEYQPTLSGSHTVEVVNAIWTICVHGDDNSYVNAIADNLIISDGAGEGARHAQIRVRSDADNSDKALRLTGTVRIKIPETPYESAYILAKYLKSDSNASFVIDATDYIVSGKVPLITVSDSASNAAVEFGMQLVVDGEVVDNASRSAALVWEGNTLYYKQEIVAEPQGVFQVGEDCFDTFAEAFAAVSEGGTIAIGEGVSEEAFETPGFKIEKSVIIDLGGKTLTLTPPAVGSAGTETLGIQILPSAQNVTIKNGTINIAASNLTADRPIMMMINNYVSGSLNLENITLDGSNLVKPANSPIYVLSNNQGAVNLTGKTSIVAPEGAIAFDVCKYKTYAIPTVTLNTTGTISGKVEVSGGDFVYEAGTIEDAIVFTSGSVKGEVEDALTIPEDKVLSEDANGAFILVDKTYAAQVGEEKFETFAAALAASNGDAITLLADVVTDFEVAGAIEINLNGYDVKATVTLTAVDSALTVGAELSNATFVVCSGYGVSYADGVYSLAKVNVAMIEGGESYGTLQDALDEAAADAVVKLIANTEENITIPATFTGTIDLGGYMLKGNIQATGTSDKRIQVTLTNGIMKSEGNVDAIKVTYCDIILSDLNFSTQRHGLRLNDNATAIINSGTYIISNDYGSHLLYLSGANAELTINDGVFGRIKVGSRESYGINVQKTDSKVNIYGGEFSGFTYIFDLTSVGVFNVYAGKYTGNIANTKKPTIMGGLYSKDPSGYLADGYKVDDTVNPGYYTVVKSWTAPLPEPDGTGGITAVYDNAVSDALANAEAQSITVTVNGDQKFGNAAVEALNAAFASFENKDGSALAFDSAEATLDIVIEITEVNIEDPAASTVVVKRGETILEIKTGVTPKVKYFYPEDEVEPWKAEKPESGAVIFKVVFEAAK